MPKTKKEKKPQIMLGGQAVIEGVMMRSPHYVSTSVRKENGKIISKKEKIKKRHKMLQKPFLRGVVGLFDTLVMGIRTLTWSANQFAEEETGNPKSQKTKSKKNKQKPQELSKTAIALTLTTSLLFAVGLFVLLPYVLTLWFGITEEAKPIMFNLVDGAIKLIILVAYILGISFMDDIKRIFQYHGAEHKAVYCHESGKKLTVKNTKPFTTLHPRCGTSFLLLVIFISIILFSFIPSIAQSIYPTINSLFWFWKRAILFSARILLIPVVAAFSFELLRLAGKYPNNPLLKIISTPGLWVQRLTTKEPDNKQIEVALKSLKDVLALEKKHSYNESS